MAWNSSKGWRNWLAIDQDCLLCKQNSKTLICPICDQDMERYALPDYDFDLLNHVRIARELKTMEFDRLLACADYHWPFSWLISELKFSRKVHHAKALAELFNRTTLPHTVIPQALIPIPLHTSRLVDRQFNQAVVIAKHISRHLRIACLPDALVRSKNTNAQTLLNAKQRLDNIQGAFQLQREFTYQHIAIFDDVITTGATISEAAGCLRRAYPTMQIDAWSICVTPQRR